MFDVKVKTLDGRNTSFTVDDEITVAEFKEKISDAVNIPASSQRLIFTGKVLANSNKLKSYNVADKVIHVVNSKPPPAAAAANGASSNATSSTAAPTGATSGPTVSMSSIPSNMIGEMMSNVMAGLPPGDAMVHHMDLRRSMVGPPQHTESGRRVVLIRQWLRDAHSLLDRIGNPSQGTRLTADSQTLEARNASQSVHHLPGGSVSVTTTTGPRPNTAGLRPGAPVRPPAPPVRVPLVNQTPRPATSRSAAVSADTNTPTTPTTPPVNPNVEVLNSLWGEVDALNSRLRVHNHRFRDLLHHPMAGCPGHNQHLFDTHSAVTHCLAHIYHALSDLQCDFSSEVHRELTAVEAPAPPPTAIIQQTIPVTIPLRATVNVAPNAARRPTSNSNTSTTSSTATDSRSAQGTAGQQGVYTSIELDMETDSGEDITDDAQRSESGAPSAPAPPVAPGAPGGFNLTQLIQDAFSGITGSLADGLHQGTPRSSTTTAATRPTPSSAASMPHGAFGSFTPPPGSATPANGPMEPQMPGLPPGFPFPQAVPPTPKDRQDPYLTSCYSKHWLPPRPTSQSNSSRPSSRSPGSTSAAARTTTTASQRNSSAGSASLQRHTTSQLPSSGNPSNRRTASEASSSADSLPSTRAEAATSEGRRQFYEGIRDSLVSLAVEQPWLSTGESRVAVPAVQRLNDRVRSAFNEAVMGRSSTLTIAELNRICLESLPSASSDSDFGVFGELCSLLFREITLSDLHLLVMGHGQRLDRLREPLRRFARFNVLQDGQPTEENMLAAVRRLGLSARDHIRDALRAVERRRGTRPGQQYDIPETVCSWLQLWLVDILAFFINGKPSVINYGQQLLDRLLRGIREGLRLGNTLFDSRSNLSESVSWTLDLVDEIIARSVVGNRMLGNVFRTFIRSQISSSGFQQSVNNIEVTSLDNLLVRANGYSMVTDSPRTLSPVSGESDYHDSVEFADAAPTTQPIQPNSLRTSIPTQTTPTPASPIDTTSLSEASAADWRAVIPADWVAIIEEDIKRQLRLESNTVDQPLSEAYLNGRPQKRRRLSDDEDEQ
ncbi:large proline-rich protein BAG6-like [Watersipora subatra]|uniref:large proline-rich protein BAG6-like n=1 Tax=Watersipora subatra TaxID=2589382 RepID=UPI00355C0801